MRETLALVMPALLAATELTYKIEWSHKSSSVPFAAAVEPIDGMPAAHPKVAGTICGESYAPGAPLPATSGWSTSGRMESGGDCRQVTSGEMFYAYFYPHHYSSNSGYNKMKTMTIYMIIDDIGDAYAVMSVDVPNNGERSAVAMTMVSNLGGTDASVVLSDDGREFIWDQATGIGQANWNWVSCCTDGGVLGPLPSSDFFIEFTMRSRHSNFKDLEFATFNSATSTVDSRVIPFDDLTLYTDPLSSRSWEFRLTGFTTEDFCASFTSCGECTVQPQCAFCGGTCQRDTQQCLSSTYTPQGSCCDDCAAHTAEVACVGAIGCVHLLGIERTPPLAFSLIERRFP